MQSAWYPSSHNKDEYSGLEGVKRAMQFCLNSRICIFQYFTFPYQLSFDISNQEKVNPAVLVFLFVSTFTASIFILQYRHHYPISRNIRIVITSYYHSVVAEFRNNKKIQRHKISTRYLQYKKRKTFLKTASQNLL